MQEYHTAFQQLIFPNKIDLPSLEESRVELNTPKEVLFKLY